MGDASVGAGAGAGWGRWGRDCRCCGEGGVRPQRPQADDGRARGRKMSLAVWIQLGVSLVAVLFIAWLVGRMGLGADPRIDRKSTRLNPVTNAHLVCRLLLE